MLKVRFLKKLKSIMGAVVLVSHHKKKPKPAIPATNNCQTQGVDIPTCCPSVKA